MMKRACTAFVCLLGVVSAAPSARAQDPPPAATGGGIDELRKEYERIRESLFSSRARAAAAGQAMYSSKVQVHLRYMTPRFFSIARTSIRVDGASVWEDTEGKIGIGDAVRFEGWVAPGKHQVSIRIEAESKDDSTFATVTESSFTIDVPNRKLVVVRGVAADNGDMGFAWKKKAKGAYKLHLDVDAEAVALPTGRTKDDK